MDVFILTTLPDVFILTTLPIERAVATLQYVLQATQDLS
jgi:hypothetical protein